MKNIFQIPLIAVLAVAACASISACSRSDQRVSGLPEKVSIASAMLPDTALDQVAAANNYYAREGLDVTRQSYQIGKQALQAVLDGKADFATVAEAPVVFAIMRGEKICIIASIDTSHNNMAVFARKESGIGKLSDLKGKRVAATYGTISEFFLDTILTINGIPRRDVSAVDLPPERLVPALENREVDAITIWNPLLVGIQNKMADRAVTFYGEDLYTQFFVVVAKQDFIRSKPEAVRKMLRALTRAEEFARHNPTAVQQIVAETTKTDASLISEIWANNNFKVELGQSLVLALEEESRWAIKDGLTKAAKVPNYLDFIYFEGLKSVKPEAVRILR